MYEEGESANEVELEEVSRLQVVAEGCTLALELLVRVLAHHHRRILRRIRYNFEVQALVVAAQRRGLWQMH